MLLQRGQFTHFLLISIYFVLLRTILPCYSESTDQDSSSPANDQNTEKHYVEGVHNTHYDHEAFLGEESESFYNLTPEESKKRLRLIADKIDYNADGYITREELRDWIRYIQRKYIRDNVEKNWKSFNSELKDKISWTDFAKQFYGSVGDFDAMGNSEEVKTYRTLYNRDKRRWQAADLDGDDNLTKEEFTAFLHPEESPHMKDLHILETLEDIDKDKDGKISFSEYIADMYKEVEVGESDPQWVISERENFEQHRDVDKDGFLNEEEVKNWVLPDDYDAADAETEHLMHEADSDNDGQLTKDEMLNRFDVFVGSQATDFGSIMLSHDEL